MKFPPFITFIKVFIVMALVKLKEEVKEFKDYETDFNYVKKYGHPSSNFHSTIIKGVPEDFDKWVDNTFKAYDDAVRDLIKSMGLCKYAFLEDTNIEIKEDDSINAKLYLVVTKKKDDGDYDIGVGLTTYKAKGNGSYFIGKDDKVIKALKYDYYNKKGK